MVSACVPLSACSPGFKLSCHPKPDSIGLRREASFGRSFVIFLSSPETICTRWRWCTNTTWMLRNPQDLSGLCGHLSWAILDLSWGLLGTIIIGDHGDDIAMASHGCVIGGSSTCKTAILGQEGPRVDPKWRKAGPTLSGPADTVKLGCPSPEVRPSRSPLGPKLGVTCAELGPLAPTWAQHGATWARLDASLAEEAPPAWSCAGPHQAQLWAQAALSWAQLGPGMLGWSWAQSDPDGP